MIQSRNIGAQPERTRLAWRRTVLAATVAVLLAIRPNLVHDMTPYRVVLISLLALCWLGLTIVAQRRIKQLAATSPGAMQGSAVLLVAAVLSFVGLAALSL